MATVDIRSEILQQTQTVEAIVWSDRFSVGHQVMDEHHRYLVSLVNQLIGLSQSVAPSAIRYERVLEELGEYIRLHLLDEERLLASVSYPLLEQHRSQYAHFIAKNKLHQLDEVVAFMHQWLLDHILVHDAKYQEYV